MSDGYDGMSLSEPRCAAGVPSSLPSISPAQAAPGNEGPVSRTWSFQDRRTERLPSRIGHERLLHSPFGEGSGVFEREGLLSIPAKSTSQSNIPGLGVRILLEGESRVTVPGFEPVVDSPDAYGILMAREPFSVVEDRPGVPSHLIGPHFSVDRLRAMFHGQRVPVKLLRFLEYGEDCHMTAPTLPAIRRIAAQIRGNPFRDAMGSLYLHGKVFELMAEVLAQLDGTQESVPRILSRDRRQRWTFGIG